MEDKPSEWAMRAAERFLCSEDDEVYIMWRHCLKGDPKTEIEPLARLIDGEFKKWMEGQDPHEWKKTGQFPI